jgi:anti-anti-sigma regulatory factor
MTVDKEEGAVVNPQKREGQREVLLAGNLTLARSLAVKGELERALEGSPVVISFGEVENVDLAFLQVLCAARRTAIRDGKEIVFRGETVPSMIAELVEDVGLHQGAGSEGDRFWATLLSGGRGGDHV